MLRSRIQSGAKKQTEIGKYAEADPRKRPAAASKTAAIERLSEKAPKVFHPAANIQRASAGKLRNNAVLARSPKSSYAWRGRCSIHFRKVGGRFRTNKFVA